MRAAYRMFVGRCEGKELLGRTGVDEKVIIK
jgi:hypothetical protein